jgi:hypothetical protein
MSSIYLFLPLICNSHAKSTPSGKCWRAERQRSAEVVQTSAPRITRIHTQSEARSRIIAAVGDTVRHRCMPPHQLLSPRRKTCARVPRWWKFNRRADVSFKARNVLLLRLPVRERERRSTTATEEPGEGASASRRRWGISMRKQLVALPSHLHGGRVVGSAAGVAEGMWGLKRERCEVKLLKSI